MFRSKRMRFLNSHYQERGGVKHVCLEWYAKGAGYDDIATRLKTETRIPISKAAVGIYMKRWQHEETESNAPVGSLAG